MKKSGGIAAAAIFTLALAPNAGADPVAAFYKGKDLTMVVGTTTGNDYDNRGRLLARHMSRHIPGNPNIVARNMPGGGGIVAANWMANVAPKDGTVLFMLMQPLSVHQALGIRKIQYDVTKFGWIGNTSDTPNVVTSWHTSGIRTIEDAQRQEMIMGATAGTLSAVYPAVLNELVGTKFRIVTGYPGGNQINLAMESGEVQGRGANSWTSWKSTRPQWLAENKIHILVQVALQRAPDLPDVPLMLELARNDFDRDVLTFLSADTAIARAVVTTPDTPADRLAALRAAFDATMKDEAMLNEAKTSNMDINYMSGEDAAKVSASIINADPKVIARARELVSPPAAQKQQK